MSEQNDDYNELNEEIEEDLVTLTLDDDTELVCSVVAIFPHNENDYIALLPVDSEEYGEEVFLYRFIQVENSDEIELLNIEDDDEFDEVADAFDEYLDANLYDEMFTDEENVE